tara:strand:+ start:3051 stop:3365 length:315 start_codon:yes stop_codon:yes gene_type:complete
MPKSKPAPVSDDQIYDNHIYAALEHHTLALGLEPDLLPPKELRGTKLGMDQLLDSLHVQTKEITSRDKLQEKEITVLKIELGKERLKLLDYKRERPGRPDYRMD